MRRLFFVAIVCILLSMVSTNESFAVYHSLKKGDEISGSFSEAVACQGYQSYTDEITGIPSFLTYFTDSVTYRTSGFICLIDIDYSIEASPTAVAGTYTFVVKYIINTSGIGTETFERNFEVSIDSADISLTPTDFPMSLSTLGSFDAPGHFPTGLGFDGTYLWNADWTDKIYKLDTSGNIIASFDSPGPDPQGLALDGIYLWVADDMDDKIYKLDTSGNIITSFDSPTSIPRGLTFDGVHLWNASWWDNKIYKLDTSGNIIASFDCPSVNPEGLAFDGRYLWNADRTYDKIYKLDTSGNIIASFDSPGSDPKGLTFDGKYLWLASYGKIYKLGEPAVGSAIRRTYTVENRGVVNLQIETVSTSGSHASEFAVEEDNCSNHSLEPMATCEFDILFTPKSEGVKNVVLHIVSNDPDTPMLTISWSLQIGDVSPPNAKGAMSWIPLLLFED